MERMKPMERNDRLVQVAGGSHAWLQGDGGWGQSNAGLVTAGDESLLVDTLFDVAHTRRMLDSLDGLTRAAPISTVVNTHGNGDHWFGNQLLADAEIIASEATIAEMRMVGPAEVRALTSMPGPTGDYTREIFGDFDFGDVEARYPSRSFTSELTITVGDTEVVLLDVGPAHTAGDTIIHVERDRVVFTGDIVFAGGTPIVWAGPFDNWVRACERILAFEPAHIVPGHGPVASARHVHDMVDYLSFVREQAERRFDAGMSAAQAARDIDLGTYAGWPESERLAANVLVAYRELGDTSEPPVSGPAVFGCMAELRTHPSDVTGGVH